MDLSKYFTDFRKTSGMTQREFAEKLGIPQTTWSGYESGKFSPPLKVLLALRENGYIIKGVNTGVLEDKATNGEISPSELNERVQIANSLAEYTLPDTPIDANWGKTVEGVYKWYKSPNGRIIKDLEKLIFNTIATQIRVSDLESRLSEVEKCLCKTSEQESEYPVKTDGKESYTSDPEPEYGHVLYAENVAAGIPIGQSEDQSLLVDVPLRYIKTKPDDYYVLQVRGNSMIDARIPDGSLALIHKSDVPRHEAIQVVRVDGRATLKLLKKNKDQSWTLCFEDGSGRTIPLGEENMVQGDFVAVLPPHTKPRMRNDD